VLRESASSSCMAATERNDGVSVDSTDVVQPSMSDRWFAWRNRKLADPRFHRWARRSPLTRYIARRRARELFDLCAGFVYSQVLSSCVELSLFDLLEDGPLNRDAIGRKVGLDREALDVLLRSAISLKLLEQRPSGKIGLGVHGAAMLANPGVSSMVQHHAFFYRDLNDPVALLRGNNDKTLLSKFWDYSNGHAADPGKQPYTELMSASQAMVAEQIIESYPLRAHQRLVDVGGGDGAFLRAVGKSAPDLDLVLFDLPAVVARAEAGGAAAGIGQRDGAQRIERIGGDMFKDALPGGADIVSLIRVVHDHDDDEVLQLLGRCRAALPQGGTLLLAEPMAVERVGDPASDAYFGLYLHAMGRGKPRTPNELEALLSRAGFERANEVRTHLPMLVRMLVARAS